MMLNISTISTTPTGCIRKLRALIYFEIIKEIIFHSDTTVTVISPNGKEEGAKILGIDDCGYLKIQFSNGKVGSVTPDNNSFDLLRGLIVPKYQA